ncbi:MAG: Spy/CpxP family protein refolding chaperone [Pseudomonadota bacterium]
MSSIRFIRNSIIVGATVFGMAAATLPAQAQSVRTADPVAQEQMKAKWQERRAARQAKMAERHAKLHDKLAITAAQEPAWASYSAAIKPAARGERGERGAWKSMSAPERMQKRIDMAKQRTAQMETRLAALNGLYAALTPEQRKLFDEASMQRGGHRKHGMHRGGQRMQG